MHEEIGGEFLCTLKRLLSIPMGGIHMQPLKATK